MSVIQAVFLGLVQGVTEFLPVSSSGHLVFFQHLFGIEEATMAFDILLHMGTLLAVFAVYRKDLLEILRKPLQRVTYLIIAGTIPTVIIALLFNDAIEAVFAGGKLLGVNFIITGLVLLYADTRREGRKKVKNMSYLDALIVGVMQGIAVFPAVSRSGMTISGALSRNLDRENAAKYSFLLSIPAILGAAVLTLKDMAGAEASVVETMGALPMTLGFIVAAVSGYLAIRFMLRVLNNGKLRYFSIYVFILGVYIILDQNLLHLIF